MSRTKQLLITLGISGTLLGGVAATVAPVLVPAAGTVAAAKPLVYMHG